MERYALNKKKYLLDPELLALTATLEKFKDKDARNYALVSLLLNTGARAQEALNITTADLFLDSQSVFITGLKNSDNREIPLPPELFKQLQQLAPEAGRVFPISYSRLIQIWHLYRPVKKKLHSLRHTFAIRLYRKTKDLRLVQVCLGHRSVANTMIYSAYDFIQSEMRLKILG